MTRKRKTWIAAAAGAVVLAIAATGTAISVSVDSRSASASWLGLTQGAIPSAPLMHPVEPVAGSTGTMISYVLWWDTVFNATAYRIWLDGIPSSVVAADVTARVQGRTVSLPCGTQHRWNVQGLNAHYVGRISPAPVYWTTAPCP